MDQFATKYLNKSVANSRGTFKGECVSLIHIYCQEVFGLDMKSVYGHAVDYWDNPSPLIKEKFTFIPKDQPRKDGDIIVWGDDTGTFTGVYGHIAIAYKGQILNQNYNNNRIVTINSMFNPGLRGYLRYKGVTMLTSKTQLNNMYTAVLERSRGAGEAENVYLNKDSGFVFDDLYKSAERAKMLTRKAETLKSLNDRVKVAEQKSVSQATSIMDLTIRLDKANKRIKELETTPVVADEKTVVENWLVRLWNNLFK